MKIRPLFEFSKYALHMRMVFFIFVLAFPLKSMGQGGYRPHPFLSPMWQADVEYLEPSQVEDTTMEN